MSLAIKGRQVAERKLAIYLLALPIAFLLSVTVYPLLHTISLSVHDFRTGAFVGTQNFLRAFNDPALVASVRVTVIYVCVAVLSEAVLGLLAAVVINRSVSSPLLRGLIYSVMIVPMVTPSVAAGVIARLIYIPGYGILNYVLRAAGIISRDVLWLSTPSSAMFCVLSVDIWQWTPFVFLVLFAGLTAVPRDIVEAALVDGASGVELFRYVELPFLKNLLLMVVMFRFADTFRVFDHVMALTGGGPGSATEFLSVYLYRIAFKFWNLNYAAAIAIFVVIVASILMYFLGKVLTSEVA
ncbi:MAG TPA: sugar ABC transporter permease [Firmicutes bacterium]|nr:sugar ABC transporter permease [Bacillota bacterium]